MVTQEKVPVEDLIKNRRLADDVTMIRMSFPSRSRSWVEKLAMVFKHNAWLKYEVETEADFDFDSPPPYQIHCEKCHRVSYNTKMICGMGDCGSGWVSAASFHNWEIEDAKTD